MIMVARILVLLWVALAVASGGISARRVIPVPLKAEEKEGSLVIDRDTKLYSNLEGEERARMSSYLESIRPFLNQQLRSMDEEAGKGIFLMKICADSVVSPEGYRLESGPDGIAITSATDAGLFYGLQTLLQLASPSLRRWAVICRCRRSIPIIRCLLNFLNARQSWSVAFRPTFGLSTYFPTVIMNI